MITPVQCRAARALIQWSQQQLAEAAKVGVVTVRQFEIGGTQPRNATLDVMQRALEAGGAVFVADGEISGGGAGVRLAKASISDTDESETIQYPEFKDGDGGPGSGG